MRWRPIIVNLITENSHINGYDSDLYFYEYLGINCV